jgi:hypothetical protein
VGAPSSPGHEDRAGTDPAAVVAALSPQARSELRRVRVPVMLPGDRTLCAAAVVMTSEHWSAVSIRAGEISIAIHASLPVRAGGGAETPNGVMVRGVTATVDLNEGIRSLSWEEGGVAYSIDVECARPLEDPRCTQDAYARALAESLVRVVPAR